MGCVSSVNCQAVLEQNFSTHTVITGCAVAQALC